VQIPKYAYFLIFFFLSLMTLVCCARLCLCISLSSSPTPYVCVCMWIFLHLSSCVIRWRCEQECLLFSQLNSLNENLFKIWFWICYSQLVKLLELREANHIEFSRIKNVADEILELHKNSELSEVLKLLMDPTSLATGLILEFETLVSMETFCLWKQLLYV